jgi:aspartyl-tRNA(Asn)/glutamyl-tRNA(Gln) amidotransferase subunit C
MSVTVDEVRRIAALSRLAVAPEREPTIAAQLNGILSHMDVLRQVPDATAHVEDTTAGMRLVADVGPAVPLTRGPQDIAPAFRDGFFLVPRLATHGATTDDLDEEAS